MAVRTPDLPFADFLEHLRHQGFEVGVEHHLRLQAVLDRLGDAMAPEDLKSHLAPLFARSADQQAQFYRAFDRFYPLFAEERDPPAEAVPEAATGLAGVARPRPRKRVGWLTILRAGTLVAAVTIVALFLLGRGGPAETPESVTPPSSGADSVAAGAVAAAADTVLETAETTAPAAQAEPGAERTDRPRDPFVPRLPSELLLLLPVLLYLSYELYLLERRKVGLVRERRSKPPSSWPLRLESHGRELFGSHEYRIAARDLRQRQESDIQRLDVDASISATLEAGGYPILRFRTDTRPPEYLLLVERSNARDHVGDYYRELGAALAQEDVHVDTYFHEGDPRVCSTEAGDRHALLSELRQRYPEHRLLLVGSGDRLLDPVTGRLEPWVAELVTWRDRALLTPEPVSGWGMREVSLARHFLVLPSGAPGLAAAADHFAGESEPRLGAWKHRLTDEELPALTGPEDLPALRRYLGQEAFQWLSSCALYPELHWDLTLFLGSIPAADGFLLTAENVLRLARLPWFRSGSIPEEMRLALSQELEPEIEQAARRGIVEMLERSPAPEGSIAADRRRLNLIVQRMFLGGRKARERKEALSELEQVPERYIEQDYALMKLLEDTRRSPLALLLPERLRRVFFRRGLPAFGLRTGVRLATTLAVTLILGLVISRYSVGQIRQTAMEAAQPRGVVVPGPDLGTLERLDAVRAAAEDLAQYSRGGWFSRLVGRVNGGATAHVEVLDLYFDRFRELLWDDTWQALVDSLRALPETPTQADAYAATFDALKAYVLMASNPTRGDTTTAAFLPPMLRRFWPATTVVAADTARVVLADAQFSFYSRELERWNPYPAITLDRRLVYATQAYLCGFSGAETLYRMLLGQAAGASAPLSWTDRTVTNAVTVPAAFTRNGWVQAQAMLSNVEALFEREAWVTGESCVVPPEQRAALQQDLRARYEAEYISRWTRFLEGGNVRYSSISDAATKLAVLSTPASPLLRMLGLVANNTNVDPADGDTAGVSNVNRAFAPVHAIVPPEATGLTTEAGAYVGGLTQLQLALGLVANSQGVRRQQAQITALTHVSTLSNQIAGIASTFSIEGGASPVGEGVITLLRSPLLAMQMAMARDRPRFAQSSADSVNAMLRSAEAHVERGDFSQALRVLSQARARVRLLRSSFPGESALVNLDRRVDLAASRAHAQCEAFREVRIERGEQAPVCQNLSARPPPQDVPPPSPAADINQMRAAFCAPFSALLQRYPFNPNAAVEATIEDVINVFRPEQGALWTFYQDELGELLLRQGSRFVARPGVSPRATPEFLAFFNQAAQISGALFGNSNEIPNVVYRLRPETTARVTEVTMSLGGQTRTFTRIRAAFQAFDWSGSAGSDARMWAMIDDSPVTVVEAPPGTWATFRLFHAAQRFDREGSDWRIVWQVPGSNETVSALLSIEGGQPVFRQQFLAQLGQCPSRIAR